MNEPYVYVLIAVCVGILVIGLLGDEKESDADSKGPLDVKNPFAKIKGADSGKAIAEASPKQKANASVNEKPDSTKLMLPPPGEKRIEAVAPSKSGLFRK